MDFASLMQSGGHAQTHAAKAVQELAGRLVDWCSPVSNISIGEDTEANDYAQLCVLTVGSKEVRAWIEVTSDGVNHPGEYRFRMLATVDGNPVDLGLADPPWIQGSGESHIDDLIGQLTAIELSVVSAARAIASAVAV